MHLHCGTASQIISGLKIASLNSRVFCSPGMGPNVTVIDLNKNPRGKCLFGLLFKIHTQMLQPKAAFKKEAAGKKKNKKIILNTLFLFFYFFII
jgi:hypothetical protein